MYTLPHHQNHLSTSIKLTPFFKPYTIYALSTSAWAVIQSLPLLLTPKLIVSLCSSGPAREITSLETYLCRTLGLTLLALSATNLLFTGVIPLGPRHPVLDSTGGQSEERNKEDVGKATTTVAVIFQALTAFYLYAQLTGSGGGWSFAFASGLVGNGVLFCFGTWTLLFAGAKGRTSKTTGADKRTSNFPFENKESAREKKKEAKEKSGKRSFLKSR